MGQSASMKEGFVPISFVGMCSRDPGHSGNILGHLWQDGQGDENGNL